MSPCQPYRRTFRYTRRVGELEVTYELDVYDNYPIMPSKETEVWQRLEARARGLDEPEVEKL